MEFQRSKGGTVIFALSASFYLLAAVWLLVIPSSFPELDLPMLNTIYLFTKSLLFFTVTMLPLTNWLTRGTMAVFLIAGICLQLYYSLPGYLGMAHVTDWDIATIMAYLSSPSNSINFVTPHCAVSEDAGGPIIY